MFLQASVILLTGGCLPQCMLGYHPPRKEAPPWEGNPPEGRTPPPPMKETPTPGIRSMSGRYASYWNAFLSFLMFESKWTIRMPITYDQCEQRLSDLQFSDVVQCEQGIAIHSIAFLTSQSEYTWKRDGQTKFSHAKNK